MKNVLIFAGGAVSAFFGSIVGTVIGVSYVVSKLPNDFLKEVNKNV